jgi:hypothetical protein
VQIDALFSASSFYPRSPKISRMVVFANQKAAFAGFLIAESKARKTFPEMEVEGFPVRLSVLDFVDNCFF